MPDDDDQKDLNTVTTASPAVPQSPAQETPAPESPAPESPAALDAERAELLSTLAGARAALVKTTEGLSDEQAAASPTVSALCLGGLVKHVTSVEDSWLRFAAGDLSLMNFDLPEGVTWDDLMSGTASRYPQWMIDHQQGFRVLPGETLAGILARYEEVAARSERIVASLPDLSTTLVLPDAPWNEPGAVRSVRRVLLHVITETSQHAGHADILREAIDGRRSS